MLDLIIDGMGWIVRMVFYQLLSTLFEKMFYWPGWLLLRLITCGRYPLTGAVSHNRFAVALFFVVSVMAIPLLCALIAL
jgi:hypothetical protein